MSNELSVLEADAKKSVPVIKTLLAELAKLSNPATDAAIVALVTKVAPGVHLNLTDILGVLGGVGIASQWIRTKLAAAAAPAVALGTVLSTLPAAVKGEVAAVKAEVQNPAPVAPLAPPAA